MISEFQDLSAKIDALAALTVDLRRENAGLRRSVTELTLANNFHEMRNGEAQARIEALLATLLATQRAPLADSPTAPEAKAAP
jgi:cell division protein ZapB